MQHRTLTELGQLENTEQKYNIKPYSCMSLEQKSAEEHTAQVCVLTSIGVTPSWCSTKYPQTCGWPVQQGPSQWFQSS